ncbi:MAG: undecaprenyldiphospho-muramoylpentapeptide beta-N-acetylglucosaminyltransferase [Alphaproteobacteria bacterium]|jgi:UDP-N-acetylglucosamine--N-acetylmuramyl-(pentapeptide) pyrophosphoryl-undecaprenol N-acetylglucosamine transferase|nr:undecaprenyldiphospho-muramoylpentapeptide beta-N-acetylglucosaminyltransferase [Alphaproteobacteria bacterium]
MGKPLIVLAAGGTGGHVMPAAALAADLAARGHAVHLITDRRGAAFSSAFGEKVTISRIASKSPAGGLFAKIRAAAALALGTVQAWLSLRRLRPAVVVGFGGYPSLPPLWAAEALAIPIVLHEQNAVMGRANAHLAQHAARIALSWPVPPGLSEDEAVRCVVTGNPVRGPIAALSVSPYGAPEVDGPLRLLVLGGSLGAGVFARVVPAAVAALPDAARGRLRVVQQCRAEDTNATRAAYEACGVQARLDPFIEDVAGEMGRAHLLVARAGASMVAEVAAAGRPAIFVPYPHHADAQQARNAQALEDAGGAWVMDEEGFTPEALAARLEAFLQDPEILFQAAGRAQALGRPDAARRLGDVVTAVAKGWRE